MFRILGLIIRLVVVPVSNLGSSLSSFFSNLATDATKAFASTQTQCSVGTTLVGNQCLPTTAVNSLALQAAASANPNALSSLISYLPLLIGGVVLMMVMNSGHGR